MVDPEQFISEIGTYYRCKGPIGYTSIPVLEFLKRRQWDAVALAYVHSLRPSSIRVVKDLETTDARCWRVTIRLNVDGTIREIKQEVEVSLPDGVVHGRALRDALQYGLDSPQVRWHLDAEMYVYNVDGYFKIIGDELIPFPKDK